MALLLYFLVCFNALPKEFCIFPALYLVELRRSFEGIRIFGTDGEALLINALFHEFRSAIHLHCFNHVHSNVKRELQERKYPDNIVGEILYLIFGKLVGMKKW